MRGKSRTDKFDPSMEYISQYAQKTLFEYIPMTDLDILPPFPALLMRTKLKDQQRSVVVVSDLHIGFSKWFQSKNVSIDWYQIVEETERGLERIITSCNADSIIILGDVKNSVSGINQEDWNVIPKFFQTLSNVCQVYVVPGNHDGNIQVLLPDSVTAIGVTGMTIDDTLLVHGHTMPSSLMSGAKKIIFGHIHPTLTRQESILDGQKVWVFLRVQKEAIFPGTYGSVDLILMPSYNRSFTQHRKVSDKGIRVPMINRIMKRNAILKCLILSIDGSVIGNEELLFTILR